MLPHHHTYGVIGPNGLIGSSFSACLSGTPVITLGRRVENNRELDLTKTTSLTTFDSIDTLVHAAGVKDENFQTAPESAAWQSNGGADNLVETIAASNVQNVIYISTAQAYGKLDRTIDEQTAPSPMNLYATAHLNFEKRLSWLAKNKGKRVVIVRPNAVYGTDVNYGQFTRIHLVPFLFPRQALEHGIIHVASSNTIRNFVSSRHIASAALHAIGLAPPGTVRIVNPVGATTCTIGDYAKLIQGIMHDVFSTRVELEIATPPANTRFTYNTRFPHPDTGPSLRDFVEKYLQHLHQCASVGPVVTGGCS